MKIVTRNRILIYVCSKILIETVHVSELTIENFILNYLCRSIIQIRVIICIIENFILFANCEIIKKFNSQRAEYRWYTIMSINRHYRIPSKIYIFQLTLN